MTDAFEALRRPDAPIAPSDSFARQLRRQLTAELQLLLTPSALGAPSERKVTMTITPYLSVRNAGAALDFYRDAFGAVETQRMLGDDGRVGHAELTIGDSKLMLADEYPEVDALGPESRGGPTCMFHLDVADVEVAYATALSFGARSLREPADQFHGSRNAVIADPFGHRWTLSTLVENLTTEQYAERAANVDEGFGGFTVETPGSDTTSNGPGHQVKHHEQGDLYYFTMPVADLAKAQAFFGAVLGWQFAGPDQGHVENISAPPGGVNNRGEDTGTRLWFVVDEIHTAVERVRANGGTSQEPVFYESGWSADCTDDQGTTFSLSVPVPEYTA
ncbi:MAG: VOC family protein [Ilumatobacteraceae bacterium]